MSTVADEEAEQFYFTSAETFAASLKIKTSDQLVTSPLPKPRGPNGMRSDLQGYARAQLCNCNRRDVSFSWLDLLTVFPSGYI